MTEEKSARRRLDELPPDERARLLQRLSEQRREGDATRHGQSHDLEERPEPRPIGTEVVPLSFSQERLWNTGKLADDPAFGNVPLVFRVSGDLDSVALGESLARLIRRHEILRARIVEREGSPAQRVEPESAAPHLELRDASGERNPEKTAREWINDAAYARFDLARMSPFRSLLVRLGPEHWILALVVHDLATDARGLEILLDDLGQLYRAARGSGTGLSTLPYQFPDYARWERQWIKGRRKQEQVRTWSEILEGVQALDLPLRQAAPDRPTFRAESVPIQVSDGTADYLRRLAREESTTLYSVLVTALQILLRSWAPENEVVVGTTISNRSRAGADSLVGNFGNNLLLPLSIDSSASFQSTLSRSVRTVTRALQHPDLPLEVLAEETNIKIPPFQTAFVLRNRSLDTALELEGLNVERLDVRPRTMPVDLTVDLAETGKTLEGKVTFRSGRLQEGVGPQLAEAYVSLLNTIAGNPQALVSRLASAPAPAAESKRPSTSRGQPNRELSSTERAVANIWADALGIEDIGPSDTFYDLGGHSLIAAGATAEIEERFGVHLEPLEFAVQTLRQIARTCEERREEASSESSKPGTIEDRPQEERESQTPRDRVSVEPTFFPDSQGPLYGVLHHTSEVATPQRAALLCPPASLEYAASHRALRMLGERLSDLGIPTLRFDWRNTGDSKDVAGGELPTLSDWRDDARTAARWLREVTGTDELVIAGVRLGATLSVLEFGNDADVAGLALWAPVTDRVDQIEPIKSALREIRKNEPKDDIEDLALRPPRGLSAVNLLNEPLPAPSNVLLLGKEDLPLVRLADRIRSQGSAVDVATPKDVSVWRQFSNVGARVPPATLREIVTWVGDL